MTFARAHIGERAAVPKTIRIIPAMPLTAVGKIFKPELKLREVEDSLAEALHSAGVPPVAVQARSDPTQGIRVDVVLAEGADLQLAQRALGQFPLQFLLTAGHR